jgi:CAAX protease family protein
MITSPSVIAHVLAFCLLLAYPLWDYFDTQQLRKGIDPRAKLRYYKETVLWLWLAAIAALWCVGANLFTRDVGLPRFVLSHRLLARFLAWAMAILIVIVSLLPQLQALRNVKVRGIVMKKYGRLSFFLPNTANEFRWYSIASITAGICEEVLYRGFLIHYLGVQPWHLGLFMAVVISSLAFGAAHLYQGAQGFLTTTIGGMIFSAVFLLTSNLLLPIIFHAAADLIAVPLLRLHAAEPPTA